MPLLLATSSCTAPHPHAASVHACLVQRRSLQDALLSAQGRLCLRLCAADGAPHLGSLLVEGVALLLERVLGSSDLRHLRGRTRREWA
jgi:hypothetical protein